MNNFQSHKHNTDLDQPYFNNKTRVRGKQQVLDKQAHRTVSLHKHIQVRIRCTSPDMTKTFNARSDDTFLENLTVSEERNKKVRIPISLEAVVVIETSNPVQSRGKIHQRQKHPLLH